MSCWDTSALVKLYLQETDSAVFESEARAAGRVAISAIGRYEAEAVFRRKEAAGALQAGDADLFQQRFDTDVRAGLISSAPLNAEVERRFSEVLRRCLTQTPPVFIRASDTLHISTALAEGETEFVTADVRQRAAAILMGLKVLP